MSNIKPEDFFKAIDKLAIDETFVIVKRKDKSTESFLLIVTVLITPTDFIWFILVSLFIIILFEFYLFFNLLKV